MPDNGQSGLEFSTVEDEDATATALAVVVSPALAEQFLVLQGMIDKNVESIRVYPTAYCAVPTGDNDRLVFPVIEASIAGIYVEFAELETGRRLSLRLDRMSQTLPTVWDATLSFCSDTTRHYVHEYTDATSTPTP